MHYRSTVEACAATYHSKKSARCARPAAMRCFPFFFSFHPVTPLTCSSEPCEPDAGWALTVTRNKSYLQLQLYH